MATMNDTEIDREIAAGGLVRKNDGHQASGACYELRMGDVYYDLTEDGARFEVASDGHAIIKPGHQVVLITREELDVPQDVLARIVSKGSLFSIGLSAVSTYADPGFEGQIGIVTHNISSQYILIPFGEPIAKIDFSRLSSPAIHKYRGQHGFETQIWPIKNQLRKSHSEVANDPRVKSEKEEAYALLPQVTSEFLRKIEKRIKWTDFGILLAILLNALALAASSTDFSDQVVSFVLSVAASVLVAILLIVVGRS